MSRNEDFSPDENEVTEKEKKNILPRHLVNTGIRRSSSAPPDEYAPESPTTPDFRADPMYVDFYHRQKRLNPRLPAPTRKIPWFNSDIKWGDLIEEKKKIKLKKEKSIKNQNKSMFNFNSSQVYEKSEEGDEKHSGNVPSTNIISGDHLGRKEIAGSYPFSAIESNLGRKEESGKQVPEMIVKEVVMNIIDDEREDDSLVKLGGSRSGSRNGSRSGSRSGSGHVSPEQNVTEGELPKSFFEKNPAVLPINRKKRSNIVETSLENEVLVNTTSPLSVFSKSQANTNSNPSHAHPKTSVIGGGKNEMTLPTNPPFSGKTSSSSSLNSSKNRFFHPTSLNETSGFGDSSNSTTSSQPLEPNVEDDHQKPAKRSYTTYSTAPNDPMSKSVEGVKDYNQYFSPLSGYPPKNTSSFYDNNKINRNVNRRVAEEEGNNHHSSVFKTPQHTNIDPQTFDSGSNNNNINNNNNNSSNNNASGNIGTSFGGGKYTTNGYTSNNRNISDGYHQQQQQRDGRNTSGTPYNNTSAYDYSSGGGGSYDQNYNPQQRYSTHEDHQSYNNENTSYGGYSNLQQQQGGGNSYGRQRNHHMMDSSRGGGGGYNNNNNSNYDRSIGRGVNSQYETQQQQQQFGRDLGGNHYQTRNFRNHHQGERVYNNNSDGGMVQGLGGEGLSNDNIGRGGGGGVGGRDYPQHHHRSRFDTNSVGNNKIGMNENRWDHHHNTANISNSNSNQDNFFTDNRGGGNMEYERNRLMRYNPNHQRMRNYNNSAMSRHSNNQDYSSNRNSYRGNFEKHGNFDHSHHHHQQQQQQQRGGGGGERDVGIRQIHPLSQPGLHYNSNNPNNYQRGTSSQDGRSFSNMYDPQSHQQQQHHHHHHSQQPQQQQRYQRGGKYDQYGGGGGGGRGMRHGGGGGRGNHHYNSSYQQRGGGLSSQQGGGGGGGMMGGGGPGGGLSKDGRQKRKHVNLSASAQRLLDQIRQESKMREYSLPLSSLLDHVVELSKDQVGSRFIQKQIEDISNFRSRGRHNQVPPFVPLPQSSGVIHEVFKKILPSALELMTDVFGNYVIQKFFEYGTSEQIHLLCQEFRGHVLELTLQTYGCRVIQKALDVIELVEDKNIIESELEKHVLECVKDQNGNHVIQKCVEKLSPDHVMFILNEFIGNVEDQATHAYGCRVIQRILEFCTESQKEALLREICASVDHLVRDQYGNYVVQHVLKHRNNSIRFSSSMSSAAEVDVTHNLIREVALRVVNFSFDKFASNVIEKCFEYGSNDEKGLVINQIVKDERQDGVLFEMMKHQYANYVVQKMIELSNVENREKLLDCVKSYIPYLKGMTYGKHIISCINRYSTQKIQI